MAGIVENLKGKALIINGTNDHLHILCHLRTRPTIDTAIQSIKGGSSSWYNKEAGRGRIEWQDGYGAFTVSFSQKDHVYKYIQNQERHHEKISFPEEYEKLLILHEVEFDKRYFLD